MEATEYQRMILKSGTNTLKMCGKLFARTLDTHKDDDLVPTWRLNTIAHKLNDITNELGYRGKALPLI